MYQNEFCVEKVKRKEREITQGFDNVGMHLAAMLQAVDQGSPTPSIVPLRN